MYKYIFYKNNIEFLTIDSSADNYLFEQEIITDCSQSDLKFGMIASRSLSLTLDNSDKSLSVNKFKNSKIEFYKNNSKKYTFYVDNVKKDNTFIYIEAYDKTLKLDKKFKSVSTPISMVDLITNICNKCDITLATTEFDFDDFIISNSTDFNKYTYRELLSYCLEVCGYFAVLNENEELVLKWFDFDNKIYIDENYITDYPEYSEEIIDINKISYTRNETEYTSGNSGDNVFYLTTNNPLLHYVKEKTVTYVLDYLYNNKLNKMSYLPCQLGFNDIEIEIGDVFTFYDEEEVERTGIVSSLTFNNSEEWSIVSCDVPSESEQTNTSDKNNAASMNEGTVYFVHNISSNREITIPFKQCSESSEFFISVTIDYTNETSGNLFNITLGDYEYEKNETIVGQNIFTLSHMIQGVEESEYNLNIVLDTSNLFTINSVNVNVLYKNAIIEEDNNNFDVVSFNGTRLMVLHLSNMINRMYNANTLKLINIEYTGCYNLKNCPWFYDKDAYNEYLKIINTTRTFYLTQNGEPYIGGVIKMRRDILKGKGTESYEFDVLYGDDASRILHDLLAGNKVQPLIDDIECLNNDELFLEVVNVTDGKLSLKVGEYLLIGITPDGNNLYDFSLLDTIDDCYV